MTDQFLPLLPQWVQEVSFNWWDRHFLAPRCSVSVFLSKGTAPTSFHLSAVSKFCPSFCPMTTACKEGRTDAEEFLTQPVCICASPQSISLFSCFWPIWLSEEMEESGFLFSFSSSQCLRLMRWMEWVKAFQASWFLILHILCHTWDIHSIFKFIPCCCPRQSHSRPWYPKHLDTYHTLPNMVLKHSLFTYILCSCPRQCHSRPWYPKHLDVNFNMMAEGSFTSVRKL